jgi:hypothetical protein
LPTRKEKLFLANPFFHFFQRKKGERREINDDGRVLWISSGKFVTETQQTEEKKSSERV